MSGCDPGHVLQVFLKIHTAFIKQAFFSRSDHKEKKKQRDRRGTLT